MQIIFGYMFLLKSNNDLKIIITKSSVKSIKDWMSDKLPQHNIDKTEAAPADSGPKGDRLDFVSPLFKPI